jgi:hypothetical protein
LSNYFDPSRQSNKMLNRDELRLVKILRQLQVAKIKDSQTMLAIRIYFK